MTSRANPEHWSRLMTLMGHEELINDPRYATPADRMQNEATVDAIITDWTLRHTKYEAMKLVGGVGVPSGAVLDTMELQNDQTFVDRGIMQTIEHPKLGSYKMPTWPVRVDGKPPLLKRAPELGEHTGSVLVSWLGMTEAEVEKLRAEGAL
jgi:formyl-CoA transferase